MANPSDGAAPFLKVRPATPDEIGVLALLWHAGWQDAHQAILPPELARTRTRESFAMRLEAALDDLFVIGPEGTPGGFYMLKGDELYQFYVSGELRGTGAAQVLIDDAEARLAARGTQVAWLACAIGNERAARFYENCEWLRAGTFQSHLDTIDGPFELEVWRYEKRLAGEA